MTRHDGRVEQETRRALEEFDKQHSLQQQECNNVVVPLQETPERTLVISICNQLQQTQSGPKQVQTEQAVALLRNMTKATQTKCMFQDSDALWGYTRQKFFERAMLVCTSFLKLNPNQQQPNDKNEELRASAWDKLCLTRRICSIGCGPGNDAVGVAAFLKAIGSSKPPLERVVLLDWAMEEWNLVVEPLCDIVVPDIMQKVNSSTCDISESLLNSDCNQHAKELLLNDDKTSTTDMDVFLISYLLTEVRGQWHDFVKEMICISQPGTLFYFAEPTPWQLHRLRAMFSNELHFLWLDSSMNHPELQPLDNRLRTRSTARTETHHSRGCKRLKTLLIN